MRALLLEILKTSAPPEALSWLEKALEDSATHFQRRPFYYAFSGVSRHFPKHGGLSPTEDQLTALRESCPGLSIQAWDQFRLARVILLLALAEQDRETFLETLAVLRNTADLRELSAIFSAYPLLPHPEELIESAIDGLRSNIVDVFDSIALDNPFPARHFSEAAWNQMVLKAIFISRPLFRIESLDRRRNADLARSVSNLAHERWAAGRKLTPEAWRNCVGYLDDPLIRDLQHLVDTGEIPNRQAVALVIVGESDPRVAHLRERLEGKLDAIGAGSISWDRLGESLTMPVGLNGAPTKP